MEINLFLTWIEWTCQHQFLLASYLKFAVISALYLECICAFLYKIQYYCIFFKYAISQCIFTNVLFQKEMFLCIFPCRNTTHLKPCCFMLLNHFQHRVTQWISDPQKVLSLTVLFSSCKLKAVASFIVSIHLIFGVPLVLLPFPFSRNIAVFCESFLVMNCVKYDNINLVILVRERVQAWFCCSVSLAVHGTHKVFLQCDISNDSFPCSLSSVFSFHIHT